MPLLPAFRFEEPMAVKLLSSALKVIPPPLPLVNFTLRLATPSSKVKRVMEPCIVGASSNFAPADILPSSLLNSTL
ncbi:hypothetical protein BN3661_02225 [Eubacteriaceae bacterium CHKCI005]|nr:hypothetical protein BN3661_02225 [Eubacteriaceae bacterium CHKCI005]